MKRYVLMTMCAALLPAFGEHKGFAQEKGTSDTTEAGDIRGHIVTMAGIKAAHAEVRIYRDNAPVIRTTADADGCYLVRMPAGDCKAVFYFPGYEPFSSGTVTVQDSKTTFLNAILKRPPIKSDGK